MGLRINTNVVALASQHKLQNSTMKLTTALERLSSGLRINKGSDDVVGLSKSESLRAQIRGIGASELNISNAINLLGVSEGTLSQLTDIGQRIREQAVQASDNTISSTDRTNLANSISDLLNEFNRLANASEFDGVKLLDGSFTAKNFQVGPNSVDRLSFSLSDARTTAVGKVAILTSITIVATGLTSTASIADPSGISIGSTTVDETIRAADGVSNASSSNSAIAMVNLINSYSGQSGVKASVFSNTVTLNLSSTGAISSGNTIAINGTTITAGNYATDTAGMNSLVSAINDKSTLTGVTATYNTTSQRLMLTASDGRNIDVRASGILSTAMVMGLSNFGFAASSTSAYATFRGTFKLFSDTAFTLSGATAEISTTTSVGLDTSTTLNNLNVSTADNAQTGIFILDNVIRQLQTRRSDVGSKTIRMGVAESELQVRKENLSSSESRIRDADIAVETANLTSAQILQQAGATVLARANSIPQIALTLLQG